MRRMVFLMVMGWAVAGGGGEPVAFEWGAMGTRVRLLVRGEGAEEAGAAMGEAARAALEAVEAETSAFREGSAVARVSAEAGNGEWVATGRAFDEALGIALGVAEATGGAFNPLVAPLMEANGFARRPEGTERGGEEGAPGALLDLGKIGRRAGACRLGAAGMALDLGGVAKGVGADWAAKAAGEAGKNDFLLDVGGTLAGRGGWTVGVRDPRGGEEAVPLKTFTLADGMAVATSGNYERQAVREDGRRVGHLFDPRTGRPAGGGVLQATAIAPTAGEADAWSTALFVLGPEEGRAVLAGRGQPVALWVVEGESGDIRLLAFPVP